ncbi:hypothetical protein Tco_1399945 [Tanacetum coccineum]
MCHRRIIVKPNVTFTRKYAIDVEPIPPRNRNNREVHLVYLRHLKESVDTLREIVEEAKVERPLDRSLAFACRYTKHSQELLEYVFGTCPKVFNQQDKKHAHTPRKKQVTFEDQIATSSSNTHKHVEPMHTQKSNVPVPPSTGVNSCTDASGSQPRSILKKHRIPPAKSDSLKKVEDHLRTIRSSLKTTNRVDSSISSKRTAAKHMTGDRTGHEYRKKVSGQLDSGMNTLVSIMVMGDYVIGDSVIIRDPLPSVAQVPVIPTGPSVSMSIDLDAPSGSHTSSPLDHHSSSVHHGVAGEQYAEVNPFAAADHEPFVNVFAPDPTTEASSSGEIMMPEINQSTQPHEHIRKWTDSHPLDNS